MNNMMDLQNIQTESIVGLKTEIDDFKVEFEIIPPVDLSLETNERKLEILKELESVEAQIQQCNARVDILNKNIDKLTNHADGLDYMVAVASGVLAGVIDSVWVGEFSIDRANSWGNEKTENFVVKIAQSQGYKGNDLAGAIKHLEEKFPIAADKGTNDFGGGKQHHLRDFAHHPTPIGLFFSLLTQFSSKMYGTDVAGIFKAVPVNDTTLIGNSLPEKITFGVVYWFFHMVSDMAGSSTSARNGISGTGLPGPIVSLLKELSSLPFFKKLNAEGYKEFSVWISKLFNGTLLAKRDENGKIIEAVKFDLRTEIGVVHELGRQAVPVIINECIVRSFYFIRRLFTEIKEKEVTNISDLKHINWENTLPIKNRAIIRMLTIATGTFTAVDMADAAIRSGGFNASCLLRVNFVGVGRFAIACGTDLKMGFDRNKLVNERIEVMSQQLTLMNAKVYYKCARLHLDYSELIEQQEEMWICANNTAETIKEAYEYTESAMITYKEDLTGIFEDLKKINSHIEKLNQYNPDVKKDMINILKWGER